MNEHRKRILIAFLPIVIMLVLIAVGMVAFKGDARFYPTAIYLGGVMLWGLWYKNKRQT